MTASKDDKADRGQGTLSIWGGEQNHEPYEHSTQVPVGHCVSFGYPDYDTWLAVAQGGFGGTLSFSVRGGLEAIKQFLPKLEFARRAANLGCVETVVGPPSVTSHVERTAEERAAAGIPEGRVRYSTGIEDVDDLIAELEQALASIR